MGPEAEGWSRTLRRREGEEGYGESQGKFTGLIVHSARK